MQNNLMSVLSVIWEGRYFLQMDSLNLSFLQEFVQDVGASLVAQWEKILSALQETQEMQVQSLG